MTWRHPLATRSGLGHARFTLDVIGLRHSIPFLAFWLLDVERVVEATVLHHHFNQPEWQMMNQPERHISQAKQNKSLISKPGKPYKAKVGSCMVGRSPYFSSEPPMYLYPHVAPGERPGVNEKKEEYRPDPGNNAIGEICAPKDQSNCFYHVQNPVIVPYLLIGVSDKTNIGMMVVPGGGSDYVAWEKEGADIGVWLNSLGIQAWVLKYRVPKRLYNLAAQVEDLQRAMGIARANATRLGITQLGAIGFSYGGNLLSQLQSHPYRMYDEIDLFDGMDYIPDFQMLIYTEGVKHYLSPNQPKPPPTFMAGAMDDGCQPPHTLKTTAFLIELHGGTVELHLYKDGHHGYGRCAIYNGEAGEGVMPDACNWVKAAVIWLSKQTNTTLTQRYDPPVLGRDDPGVKWDPTKPSPALYLAQARKRTYEENVRQAIHQSIQDQFGGYARSW